MKHRNNNIAITLACLGLLAGGAASAQESAELTGHIDVVSRYVLRGISTTYGPAAPGVGNAGADAPESDKAALQWGVDWVHPSGFYAGYFGSTVNYSYKRLGQSYLDRTIVDFQSDKSIENDFYAGYTGKAGNVGYELGMTGYVYINGKHANALETKLGLSYGDFSVAAQTLLQDVVWGNKGDTYWTLNYSKELPHALTLSASLGYYTYGKEGKFLGTVDTATNTACAAGTSFVVSGCFAGNAPVGSAFRHLIIGVSQPIGNTGASWSLQGLFGGDNRFGVKQRNQLLGSISYGF